MLDRPKDIDELLERLLDAHEATSLQLEWIRLILEHQFGVEVTNNEFGDPYIREVNERSA
jgi:hypothetical protein